MFFSLFCHLGRLWIFGGGGRESKSGRGMKRRLETGLKVRSRTGTKEMSAASSIGEGLVVTSPSRRRLLRVI